MNSWGNNLHPQGPTQLHTPRPPVSDCYSRSQPSTSTDRQHLRHEQDGQPSSDEEDVHLTEL